MELTTEQTAVVAEGRTGKGDILMRALAGCAKTTTLIEIIKVMSQRSVLFAAFNKGIADEAQARMPRLPGRAVIVKTLHALGLSILSKHFPDLVVESYGPTDRLVSDACGFHTRIST